MLLQNGALKALHKAVGPGMSGLDASVADPQLTAGLIKGALELAAPVREPPLDRPTCGLKEGDELLLQEACSMLGSSRRNDDGRSVGTGRSALPSFQRSYVWDNLRIANYLMALFENKPTGIFLILETSDSGPQFVSRTLKGNAVDADPAEIEELVLDGQQRLTSLWNVLRGTASRRFYIEVEDLNNRNMEVKQITSYLDNAGQGRTLRDPTIAFNKNFLPLDILYKEEGGEGWILS